MQSRNWGGGIPSAAWWVTMMSLCVALKGISRASSPNRIGSTRPLRMTYYPGKGGYGNEIPSPLRHWYVPATALILVDTTLASMS